MPRRRAATRQQKPADSAAATAATGGRRLDRRTRAARRIAETRAALVTSLPPRALDDPAVLLALEGASELAVVATDARRSHLLTGAPRLSEVVSCERCAFASLGRLEALATSRPASPKRKPPAKRKPKPKPVGILDTIDRQMAEGDRALAKLLRDVGASP